MLADSEHAWLATSSDTYALATVTRSPDDGTVTLRADDGTTATVAAADVLLANAATAEDMTQLSHLHEPAVLDNLRRRFEEGHVYTRTGLICIAMLGLLVLRESRHKVLLMFGGALLCVAAFPFLPQSYAERMATMVTAEEDESASTRVAVWEWTIDYAKEHPLGGGFEAYRANSFTYRMPQTTGEGNMTTTRFEEVVDEGRAYHSAIFEMLGEQGYPGLAAWLLLQALGLIQMEVLRRRMRKRADTQLEWLGHLAIALQYAQVIYLVGALFQGLAWQPFIMMLAALQIALVIYARRVDSPQGGTIGERLAAERKRAAQEQAHAGQPAPAFGDAGSAK